MVVSVYSCLGSKKREPLASCYLLEATQTVSQQNLRKTTTNAKRFSPSLEVKQQMNAAAAMPLLRIVLVV
jgi:hypothetical protein